MKNSNNDDIEDNFVIVTPSILSKLNGYGTHLNDRPNKGVQVFKAAAELSSLALKDMTITKYGTMNVMSTRIR